MIEKSDFEYMELALSEAAKCHSEKVQPTPKVGAVYVRDGTIIAKAFRGEIPHHDGAHAEFTAMELKAGTDILSGCTVYTTLEPCTTRNHPKIPCANRLVERRVKRVVIGMIDPDQRICGRGIRLLRSAGIEVDLFPDHLMKKVEEQNRDFIHDREHMSTAVTTELFPSAGINQINPHYRTDLVRLDSSKFDLNSIRNRDTILIVTGDGIVCELLDRPVAGMLRDEIDRRGNGAPFKRGIIISSTKWIQDEAFQKYHTISIGGSDANQVTKYLQSGILKPAVSPWRVGGKPNLLAVHQQAKPCRLALWGYLAIETREAVEIYIKNEKGLTDFLDWCWK